MANSDYKQHISIEERRKWDKNVADFNNHLGSGGINNHPLGNGTVPGFSMNDYTNDEKDKLGTVERNANAYKHPSTHDWTMITGLKNIANTASYHDLVDVPSTFIAGGGDSDTVGGIRFTIGPTAPNNPVNSKDVWFNTSSKLLTVYYDNKWNNFHAVYS